MSQVTITVANQQVHSYADQRGFQTTVRGDGRVEDEVVVAFTDRGERYAPQMITDVSDPRLARFIYDPLPHAAGQPPAQLDRDALRNPVPQSLGLLWDVSDDRVQDGRRQEIEAILVPDGCAYQTLRVDYEAGEITLQTHVQNADERRERFPSNIDHWVIASFDPATGRVIPETAHERMSFKF